MDKHPNKVPGNFQTDSSDIMLKSQAADVIVNVKDLVSFTEYKNEA